MPARLTETDREARGRRIVTTACDLAEAEGWEAVTTRRLSTLLGFSQPVLYGHFPTMDAIRDAAALSGFTEMERLLRQANRNPGTPASALRVATAYLDFADRHPALYDAMFTSASSLAFADTASPPQLVGAFTALRDVVGGDETRTELLWAGLHGLVSLQNAHRLRPRRRTARLRMLVEALLP